MEKVTLDTTRIVAVVSQDGRWTINEDGYTICIPVIIGTKLIVNWTNTASATVGTVYRWGLSDTNIPTGQYLRHWKRSSPSLSSHIELVVDKPYFIIQVGDTYASTIFSNEYLEVYTDTIQSVEIIDTISRRKAIASMQRTPVKIINLVDAVQWEHGTISATTGKTLTELKNDSETYYDTRQRTASLVDTSGSDWLLTANWSEYPNLRVFVMRFDINKLSESRNITKTVDYPINDADYITCVVAKTDDSQVTYQDVLNLNPRLIEVIGDWDYKWKYTDGLPPAADGWSTTTSGTGAFTLKSNCLETKCNNSAYRFYGKSISATVGVLEAVVNAPSSSTTGSPRCFLRFGDSTTALFVYFTYASGRKIKICDGSTFANGTNIGTWDYNFYYTLRLEINNGVGAVYLDNQLVKSNINMSTIQYPGNIRFGIQNGSGLTSQWKSMKYRIGRI